MKFLIIINVFATIFLACAAYPCPITDFNKVHVINRLPNPRLRLHCASGDTELGYHLTLTNYNFHWSFCDRWDGRTLFFCHLWWRKPGQPREVAFDVFTRKIKERCKGICIWEARIDGIYLSSGVGPRNFTKKHLWEISTAM